MLSPVLGPSSSAACSVQAAVLLKHLESALGGILVGHHAKSHSAWGLASNVAEALQLLNQGDDENLVPLSRDLRAAVVDILEQVAGGLMMAGHSGIA